MSLEWDLDLEGWDEEDLEKGGMLKQPGWYQAVVTDISEDSKTAGVVVFTFEVTHGPHKGSKVFDRLWPPDLAEDADKAEKSRRRAGLYASRLGLLEGRAGEARKIDWEEALDREVVLQVEVNRYKDKETDQWVTNGVKLDYAGVYPPDHPKIPDDIRKALGLPKARNKGAEGGEGEAGNGARVPPKPPGGPIPRQGRAEPASRHKVNMDNL